MPRISTDNYDTVASWNGSQDLFVVEQPDGTKVATPAMVKQYVLNDMDDVPTENSNNPVKSGGIFSTMAVPKYDATNRREYYEGGAAFDGNIDSSPTAGSNNAVASGGTYTALTAKADKSVFTYSSVTGLQTIAGRSYKQIFTNLPPGKYLISSSYVNENNALCILTKSTSLDTNFADIGSTGGVGICELSSASNIYLYINTATTDNCTFYRCRFVAIKLD